MKIVIINLAYYTNTPTGGDTIAIESAKGWRSAGHEVTVLTTQSGAQYCVSHGFPKDSINVLPFSSFDFLGYDISIFLKTVCSFFAVFFLLRTTYDVYFASSFFLPDSVPAAILKMLHPRSVFLTSMYVYTKRFFGTEYSGGKVKGFFFWVHEAIAVKSISWLNGYVLTSSTYDAHELIRLTGFSPSHVHAVGGGVDTAFFTSVPSQTVQYTAVFIGRFKPQKCIDTLLEIWAEVLASKPYWNLAIIGGGPLEQSLRSKCATLGISHAVSFLGVLDGIQKALVLKSSRMFISASLYDTGNIALDEALACHIPGILYDLPSMPYDQGVIHIPKGNTHAFAQAIIALGTDATLHKSLSQGAKRYADAIDWKTRANQLMVFITNAGA